MVFISFYFEEKPLRHIIAIRRPRKMDSQLSLDELFVSFPNQALKSRSRNRRREEFEESDVFRESSGDRINSYDRAEGKGEIHRRNTAFTVADYVQANEDRESYAGKLPTVRPMSVRQRNILKKERNRQEFSCIDLDDCSGWEKPAMANSRRVGKEGTICRNNLPSPGSQHCSSEEKRGRSAILQPSFAKKEASDSPNSFNAVVYRPRQLSLGSSTELYGQKAERRVSFSPPVTPKPERPVDLSDKFTRFLEREFSIIKGESVCSTIRTPFRSDSDFSQERGSLNSDSTERSESVGKPVMGNENRNIKERSKHSTRRDTLPSTGLRRWAGEAKWESADSVTESSFINKISSDSPNLSNTSPAKLDLSRRAESLPSERRGPFTASQRDMSPRSSRKEFEDRPLFSPSESRRHVKELPLDLPEKLAKFIEVEFSIIRGEDKSSVQRQKYGVSAETVSPRESPKELRKSLSSLLQRRGRQENDVH